MEMQLYAGLDLGKKRDFTAIAVLEQATERRETVPGSHTFRDVRTYTVRQLDRVRQESYEAVADSVAGLMRLPAMRNATLAVDETGVGTAVTDMLRLRDLSPRAATITGGDKVTRDGHNYRIPKRDLVTTVNVLLESRRLKIPTALPLARTLADELHTFKVTISPLGHDSYGAGGEWREGQHDDLVLAVALAAWFGENTSSTSVIFTPPPRLDIDVNAGIDVRDLFDPEEDDMLSGWESYRSGE
jgi:phage FluMu gp28-like protein